jgi:predicted nucleic acid-binding Zn ribbon protein
MAAPMSRATRRPGRLDDTLRQVVQRIDPDRRLAAYRLWTFWDELVGEAVAARAQPSAYRDGVLSVRVNGAAWMQELQFAKETLRARINERLGDALIRDLYFISGTVTRAAAPRPAAPPPANEPEDDTPLALPAVRDPRLAAVLARIARAHRRRGRG